MSLALSARLATAMRASSAILVNSLSKSGSVNWFEFHIGLARRLLKMAGHELLLRPSPADEGPQASISHVLVR